MNKKMINLNDHYFIAWLSVEKQLDYSINNGRISVEMSSEEYTEYLEEYRETYKPILSKIRKVVKELNHLTSKSKR